MNDHYRPIAAVGKGLGDRISARTGYGVPRFKPLSPPSMLSMSPPPPAAVFSPFSYFALPLGLSPSELLDSPVLLSSASNKQQKWVHQESPCPNIASSFSSELQSMQSSFDSRKRSDEDEGYKWRKYGQKQVKGSDNPRSYYKCTYPNCPTKKKVERSSYDGQIANIAVKGTHNHPKPTTSQKSSSSSSSSVVTQSYGTQCRSNEVDDISYGLNGFEQSNHKRKSSGDPEHNAKRWKGKESDQSEGIIVKEIRTTREARVVVQTVSDVDILDDGFRWRKYGQKVVKGNPNPRSYYKCTGQECQVKKHVQRAAQDVRSVITTYEGKHNHDVPPTRSRQGPFNSLSGPTPYFPNDNVVRPSVASTHNSARPQGSESPSRSYQYPRFGDFNISPTQEYDRMSLFPRAKDEPRDP